MEGERGPISYGKSPVILTWEISNARKSRLPVGLMNLFRSYRALCPGSGVKVGT